MVTSRVSHGGVLEPEAARVRGRTEERVLFLLRQSLAAPLVTMWPVAVGGIVWLALNGLSLGLTGQLLPEPLQLGIFALLLALAARWLIRDGLNWYACSYTLTNTRLIVAWGVLSRRRRQAPLAHIQNVRVIWPNLLSNLLDIGDVGVRTAGAGGDLRLTGVRQPEAVARAITEAQRTVSGARREPALARDQSKSADGDRVSAVAKAVLLAMDAMGGLADVGPDGDGREVQEPGGGGSVADGVLRRALVSLLPGERVVARLHRHWFALLRKLALPVAMGVVLVIAGAFVRSLFAPAATNLSWAITSAGALTLLAWGGLVTLNYMDDVFILTTRRIIDIDRRYAILAEARREALYGAIQDVAVSAPPLGRIFGYGRIVVETAGQAPNIEMDNIARPLETQDHIFALIRREKQRAAAKESQTQRRDLRTVVGQALSALLIPMPDARGLPVTEAVTRLQRAGLSVNIVAQRVSAPGAPGIVLGQSPRPGAVLVRGGEAQIVVSRPNPASPPTPPPRPHGAIASQPGMPPAGWA
ncbi:MAG TPA: PH domain-containing protein [Ktedonobacterales bacterium]|nr:PH domain-containing protein [Ktedonobacterales bacterium]